MGRNSLIFTLAIGLAASAADPSLAENVPHQFIAKTYTEALGRVPDSTGYGLSVQMFRAQGCSADLLRGWARQFYDSPMHPSSTEFEADYPKGAGATTADSIARILTVSRGILNRDPTAAEFREWLDDYRRTPWWAVLERVLDSVEFDRLAEKICTRDFYGFGGKQFPAIDVPFVAPAFEVIDCSTVCGDFGSCRSDDPDPDALQSAMYCASRQAGPNGTAIFELAPQAVFRLHSTLVIPGNVVLRTRAPAGGWQWFPGRQYALMARLVRASNFGGSLVHLNRVTFGGIAVGRARLECVWVDGQRGPIEVNRPDLNVSISGGKGSEVFGCRINDSAGWTNLLADGMSAGTECEQSIIRKNLITDYTGCHAKRDGPDLWVDGISTSCENTVIEDNQIVDVTDVGIVIYRGTPSTTQRSVARRNSVFNSGNSAWAALVADPMFGAGNREYDFNGTRFEDNLIWTGDGHFDIGLLVGTAAIAWAAQADIGRGATFVGNSVGWPALACSARVDMGIVVSGMLDATVTGNRLGLQLVDMSTCPEATPQCGGPPQATAAVVASRCAGTASGTIQDALDFRVYRCLGHPPTYPDCDSGFNLPPDVDWWPFVSRVPPPSLDAVFPNPTRGQLVVRFTLTTPETAELELLDVAGRRLAHRTAEGSVTESREITLLDGERLRPGIYVVKLSQGDRHSMRRIVVLD